MPEILRDSSQCLSPLWQVWLSLSLPMAARVISVSVSQTFSLTNTKSWKVFPLQLKKKKSKMFFSSTLLILFSKKHIIWGTFPHLKWRYFCQLKNQALSLASLFLLLALFSWYPFIAGYFSSFMPHHDANVSTSERFSLPSASSCLPITFSYFVLFIEFVNVSFIIYIYLFTCLSSSHLSNKGKETFSCSFFF